MFSKTKTRSVPFHINSIYIFQNKNQIFALYINPIYVFQKKKNHIYAFHINLIYIFFKTKPDLYFSTKISIFIKKKKKKNLFSYIYKNKTRSEFLSKTHSFSPWKLKSRFLMRQSHHTFFVQNKIPNQRFLNSILTLDLEFDMAFVAYHLTFWIWVFNDHLKSRRPDFVRAKWVPNTFPFCNLTPKP